MLCGCGLVSGLDKLHASDASDVDVTADDEAGEAGSADGGLNRDQFWRK